MPGKEEIKISSFLNKFECLGEKCEDTCCKGWGMQIDESHKQLYVREAPELLDSITSGEAHIIMRRNPETDYCVKFEDGLCGIHKKYGSDFLGDACHFYPRITRKIGGTIFMTGALSCPEVTRLMLFGEEPFSLAQASIDRLPLELKTYATYDKGDASLNLIHQLIDIAGDETTTPEHALAVILTICRSLESQPEEKWPEVFPTYRKIAHSLLPKPEGNIADGYRLVNILVALIEAARKSDRPRLNDTVKAMECALNISINRKTLEINNLTGRDTSSYEKLEQKWREKANKKMSYVMRRWIQAQIAMNSFPYSGIGNNLHERRIILAVRFATVRLALMSHMDKNGNPPDEATVIRVIQSLSRFQDHLADPSFSLMAYAEAGWNRESNLRALIGDM